LYGVVLCWSKIFNGIYTQKHDFKLNEVKITNRAGARLPPNPPIWGHGGERAPYGNERPYIQVQKGHICKWPIKVKGLIEGFEWASLGYLRLTQACAGSDYKLLLFRTKQRT